MCLQDREAKLVAAEADLQRRQSDLERQHAARMSEAEAAVRRLQVWCLPGTLLLPKLVAVMTLAAGNSLGLAMLLHPAGTALNALVEKAVWRADVLLETFPACGRIPIVLLAVLDYALAVG